MNLELFAQDVHDLKNIFDLKKLVDTSVRRVLNHEMALCVIGDLKNRSVIRLINIGFPDKYLHYAVQPDQSINCYLIHKWIVSQQPYFFRAEDVNTNGDKIWLNVLKNCKIKTLVSHGVVDPCNHCFSYFAFANIDTSTSDEILTKLISITPFLNYAVSRVLTLNQITNYSNLPSDSFVPFENLKYLSSVTPREKEIVSWIALGKKNEEIAQILGISQHTVNNHIKSLFKRLDVTSRAQAVSKAASLSLILASLTGC